MANIKSAAKRARQNILRGKRNRVVKDKIKETRRAVLQLKKDSPDLKEAMASMQKAVDKAVKTGVIHKNRASRIKSRISRRLKS